MNVRIIYKTIKDGLNGLKMTYFSSRRDHYGYIDKTSKVKSPVFGPKQNVYIYEYCGINSGAKFICNSGKFIMKHNCSVGTDLTVITCNHKYDQVGIIPNDSNWNEAYYNDVIVNDCVWIGANVTLCPGTIIGRGCIVAAGSVCVRSHDYPPYSIIGGNPAKFIKFRLSLAEQKQQEIKMYKEENRIPFDTLVSSYNRFSKTK